MENSSGVSISLSESPKKEKKKIETQIQQEKMEEVRGERGGAKSWELKKCPNANWVHDEKFISRHQQELDISFRVLSLRVTKM